MDYSGNPARRIDRRAGTWTVLLWAALLSGCGQRNPAPPPPTAGQPPGQEKSAQTHALETGADALPTRPPLRGLDVYMAGFHAAKDNPALQTEAHHYCHRVNEEFSQCVLFDGDGDQANLIGIEYIISERLFDTLPETEQGYWHPHNYEILSGQLMVPGMPEIAEMALLSGKLNSYGKTWHVWNAAPFGRPPDALPVGPPMLEWSFNHDGEALPGLVEQRDRRMGLDSGQERGQRAQLVSSARPQAGVEALKGKFVGTTHPIPGVSERKPVSEAPKPPPPEPPPKTIPPKAAPSKHRL
ncbi:Protein of unknown function [Methylomagnum ishizawai]|uniref:Outer membrane or secreted lipoprotein n=1 Tax=Methylomagnum ishizawai TaxID=1760988 RepID=A0A1Y6D5U8_9GAMM|nr:OBAP family protein [Methylomagnum ishizawai]SMF95922.1 Protein of unknown function [Methylomagnum ishizawai]